MWVDFLAYHAQYRGDFPAVISPQGIKSSYRALHQEANRWACIFQGQGVVKGDRVAFLAPNRMEHLSMFFACTRLGAIWVPLNYRLASAEIEAQLQWIEPKLAIASHDLLRSGFCSLEELGRESGLPFCPCTIEAQDPLLMLFTSGSTAQPKGVLLHAEMLLWNAINTQMAWSLSPDDRSIIHTPFFHTGGYNVIALPLLRLGATLVLTDRFDAAQVMRLVTQFSITFLFAVPTMYQMMLDMPEFETWHAPSLRVCVSGGAACPGHIMESFRAKDIPLKQGFGLTEVGPNCFVMSDEEALARPSSIGRACLHSHVALVDDQGQTVGPNQVGECAIAGPHVCLGYFRQESLFQRYMRNGHFLTGDLMRQDAEGYFYVVGRKKEMYISGGENVYPTEIANVLLRHPDIHNAHILAVPNATWGEVGYCFLESRRTFDLAEIRSYLEPHLARYKHPFFVRCLDQFPIMANGKWDLKQLSQLAHEEVRV